MTTKPRQILLRSYASYPSETICFYSLWRIRILLWMLLKRNTSLISLTTRVRQSETSFSSSSVFHIYFKRGRFIWVCAERQKTNQRCRMSHDARHSAIIWSEHELQSISLELFLRFFFFKAISCKINIALPSDHHKNLQHNTADDCLVQRQTFRWEESNQKESVRMLWDYSVTRAGTVWPRCEPILLHRQSISSDQPPPPANRSLSHQLLIK